jgi:hypothetical protein
LKKLAGLDRDFESRNSPLFARTITYNADREEELNENKSSHRVKKEQKKGENKIIKLIQKPFV